MRVDPGPAGLPLNVTPRTFPAKRQSTNSARAGVQPSSRASSNEHRSKRVPSGLIGRRSAPSNLHDTKVLRGLVVKNGANFSSRRNPRKSQATKFATASWNLSKRAFRKSTFASPARPTETTPGWTSPGCGSLPTEGPLGALSCWDTPPRGQLSFVGKLRRLLRVRLLAVLDEDPVDLREKTVHELVLGERAHDLPLAEDRALAHAAGDPDVGVLCLAGSVHLAAHDRHLHRHRQRAEALFRDLGERDEVDVRPAAGRAGHEREPLVTQAER